MVSLALSYIMVLVLVIHLDILYLSFIPFHLQVQRNLVQMVSRVKKAPQQLLCINPVLLRLY